jgi:hypothetical protein
LPFRDVVRFVREWAFRILDTEVGAYQDSPAQAQLVAQIAPGVIKRAAGGIRRPRAAAPLRTNPRAPAGKHLAASGIPYSAAVISIEGSKVVGYDYQHEHRIA